MCPTPFIYLSIYLAILVHIYLQYLKILFIDVCIYVCMYHMLMRTYVYLKFSQSIYLSFFLSIYLSIYLSCNCLWLSVCWMRKVWNPGSQAQQIYIYIYIYIYILYIYVVNSISFQTFLYEHLKLTKTLENSVWYCYTTYEMTDQFLWFQVQRNSYSSNWNAPY